jgi:hypothetical protein
MSSDESRASDDAMGVVTTCVYASQLGSIIYRNGFILRVHLLCSVANVRV